MSTYQGAIGGECSAGALVLPKLESHLSGGQRTSLLAEATIYNHQNITGKQQFASAADYMRYKKARLMAGTQFCTEGRPPQSSIITDLIANRIVAPTIAGFTISGLFSPSPPYDATYNIGWDILWNPVPDTTASFVVTAGDCGQAITAQTYVINSSGSASVYAFISGDSCDVTITMTLTSVYGSATVSEPAGVCFLAGSRVAMANGSEKSIEDVLVGDIVIGAFGETNTVLALHRPLLGANRMCVINGDHHTSNHHPHIGVGKEFYSNDIAWLQSATYGQEHAVINGAGEVEQRMLHGLRPDRVQPMTLGIHLKTITGSRAVDTLDVYNMPPETQLYNLVISGSHTYHVDGYAVTGWPREDDFDYDSWS